MGNLFIVHKRKGKDVTVYLDRNENHYGPAPACLAVLRSVGRDHINLYSRDYVHGRKSELSLRLSRDSAVPEERVLLSYGSEDMIKQVTHCYLKKGELMLIPQYSWWYYKALASETGGKSVEYAMRDTGTEFIYDTEDLLRLSAKHKPAIILIASPNNPTGNSLPLDDLKAILAHCKDAVIVLDQAYDGFAGDSALDIPALLRTHPRLVIVRTFSKYYALAGLRIGYAFAGEGLGELMRFSARYLGYNRLTERVALAALDERSYYQQITQQMREDRDRYMKELSKLEGFTPYRSDANFVLVRFPARFRSILRDGLERRGVIVKFLEDPGLADCMRITIGTRAQNAIALEAIKEIAVSELAIVLREDVGNDRPRRLVSNT